MPVSTAPAPVPVPAAAAELLAGLTPEQTEVVTYGAGPQVVFAVPGAGKTLALITRVLYLLAADLASPSQIVVVTFTNNAAAECVERIQSSLGRDAVGGMLICTFHSLCSRILRQHAPRFARNSNFTIYDQRAVQSLVEVVLEDKQLPAIQAELARVTPCSAAEMHNEISLAKNRLWTPGFYAQHATHDLAPLIAAVWAAVDRELADSNAVDFDDLLCCCVRLLGEHPDLQMHYRNRWRCLLVDEVQDTNYAQMGLVRLLSAPDGNVTVVGDSDQALYRWRGAEPRNLLEFSASFPGHREVVLGRNFRSREEIVLAAENVITKNTSRPAIDFVADRGPGGRVLVRGFDNEFAEAGWITGEIARQLSSGLAASEISVIARTSFATQAVQRALAQAGIKHHVLGSLGLYERSNIKDALAYLALLVNPHDAIAFRRAITAPRRGVGDVTAAELVAHAREQGLDLLTACTRAEELARARASARENLVKFGEAMVAVRAAHDCGASLAETVTAVLMLDGGLVAHHQHRRDESKKGIERDDAERMLEDLRSVRHSARAYKRESGEGGASLLGFLERAVGLHSDEPSDPDPVVTVSTIHRAKGTEASVVFLCGCEEGISPSWRALATGNPYDLEEERCAFYVGMTRAADLLVLTWSGVRKGRATRGRSRFLDDAGL